MKMIDLAIGDQSQEDMEIESPKYPYGTCLYLDDAMCAKLGIKKASDLPVGTELSIDALAKVTGTSEREYEGGKHLCIDIQLTAMALEGGEDAGEDDAETSDVGSKLYGK